MNLNKLRTFTLVAEYENVSKAAAAMFRTQPAITAQIRELEKETGLSLFERRKSKIYLTREGRQLYHYAKPRIAEIDDYVVDLRSNSGTLEGRIRFGVHWELSSYLVPDILKRFRSLYPLVCFEVIQGDHDALESQLTNGLLDVGLTILYKDRGLLETRPFITFERNVVASPDYLATVADIQGFEDLMTLDFIGFDLRLDDYRFWLKKNGQGHLVNAIEQVSTPVAVKELHTAQALIRMGVGIGFADSFMLGSELASGTLVPVVPEAEPIYVSVDVSRPRARTPNRLLDCFYDFLADSTVSDTPPA